MASAKTDNADPAAKLDLRRYFLKRYHEERTLVFDACQGEQRLWKTLRNEFSVQYWGVDTKPGKGRIAIDSVRLLATPGWRFDIIDIDTCGSPWRHWKALLPGVKQPTTIFLTEGATVFRNISTAALRAAGVIFRTPLPVALGAKLHDIARPFLFDQARQAGLEIRDAQEAPSTGSARYFGLRLEPADEPAPENPSSF